MKYIAYCRKSTDESDRQILSIESQIGELKDFASHQNLEILDFVIEAKTAKIPFIVSPITIQLELATIPLQFKDVLVALAVRFV